MKRGMYLAAALCLLLCGCGKKDAAEAQAVQQRYAALTGAVAEAGRLAASRCAAPVTGQKTRPPPR